MWLHVYTILYATSRTGKVCGNYLHHGHEFTSGNVLSPIYNFMPTHTRFLCFYLEDPVKVKKRSGTFGAPPGHKNRATAYTGNPRSWKKACRRNCSVQAIRAVSPARNPVERNHRP